jgi:hypothetical protein
MKKPSAKSADKEMQAEYDFSHGVRSKYFRRYHRGANVVVLEPDVAKAFPNAEVVNDCLRALTKTQLRTAEIIRKASQMLHERKKV